MVLYCPLGYDDNYRVPVTWNTDDADVISKAVASARRHFQLSSPENPDAQA
jgi:hypothetical protein